MTWKVTEVTVQAIYVSNHAPDTLSIRCASVSRVPGGVENDELFKYPRLIARGLDPASLRTITWFPNNLHFRDLDTDEKLSFSVRLLGVSGDTATFVVH